MKSGISCKMLLTIFGLLRSVKVACNCRTVFSLHLHKLIASHHLQGTVLGPLLFLLYINDITGNIQSNIRLFADDCIMYRTSFPDDSRKSISHNCANHPGRLCESSAAKRGFQMIRAKRLRESSGTVCARLRESSSGK